MLVTPTFDGEEAQQPDDERSGTRSAPLSKPGVDGSGSRPVRRGSLSLTLDPHDSKLPPDHPGLEIERSPIRVLKKGPITAIGLIVILLAATALWKGFLGGESGSPSAQTAMPADPQVPGAPNLQVADLVKDAPDNRSPVLVAASAKPDSSPPPTASDFGPLGALPPDAGVPAPAPPAVPPPGPLQPATPSPAQVQREARRQLLDRINAAGVAFKAEGSEPASPPGAGQLPPGATAQPLGYPGGLPAGVPPMPQPAGAGDADPNGQGEKRAFLKDTAKDQSTYVASRITGPATQLELLAGDIIPAVLITAINSDLPGQVIARVTRNVRDTVSREVLLIPQGSTLLGRYDSSVVYGQDRVLLCWQRLIRPDGSSQLLECAPAVDQAGAAGITGDVDNHWAKLITGVVLSSLLAATTQAATGDIQGYRPNLAQSWAAGAAGEIGAAGQQITRRNLAVQPTIKIPSGAPINVFVSKDLLLTPYPDPVQ